MNIRQKLLCFWLAFGVSVGCSQNEDTDLSVGVGLPGQRALSSGSDVSTPSFARTTVRVVRVPQGGSVPDAEVDDQGAIHLAYFSNGNVYYVRSSDNGETFENPIRVNDEVGFAIGGAYRGPDLAVDSSGRVHVVWYNAAYQQERPKVEWGVMYSRLSQDASGFEPARNLNQTPSDNYSLAVRDNMLGVVWMANGVFANVSHDGGDRFSESKDLQADPCECCGSRALFAADDTLCVLYRDKADNDRDTYLALLDHTGEGATHRKVSQADWHINSCPMTGSFLAAAPDGLIAGWETKGNIYFARLDSRGQMTSKSEILAAKEGRYPVVLATGDGVVAAWKNRTTLQWQLFDGKDKAIGPLRSMAGTTRDRPAGVVARDGTVLLFP